MPRASACSAPNRSLVSAGVHAQAAAAAGTAIKHTGKHMLRRSSGGGAHGVRPSLPGESGSAPASSSVRSSPSWLSFIAQIRGPSGEAAACTAEEQGGRWLPCAAQPCREGRVAHSESPELPAWQGRVAPRTADPAALPAAAAPLHPCRPQRQVWRRQRQRQRRWRSGGPPRRSSAARLPPWRLQLALQFAKRQQVSGPRR